MEDGRLLSDAGAVFVYRLVLSAASDEDMPSWELVDSLLSPTPTGGNRQALRGARFGAEVRLQPGRVFTTLLISQPEATPLGEVLAAGAVHMFQLMVGPEVLSDGAAEGTALLLTNKLVVRHTAWWVPPSPGLPPQGPR